MNILARIPNSDHCNSLLKTNHIVFEGLARAGKSSTIDQVRNLLQIDTKKNWFLTERPTHLFDGCGQLKEKIDELYQGSVWDKRELLKIFTKVIEFQENANEISNQLDNEKIVISDRQKFSVIAILRATGLPWDELYKATGNIQTAGTNILFDIDPQTSVDRSGETLSGKGSYWKNDIGFQTKVSEAFHELAQNHPEIQVIDARKPLNDVMGTAIQIIEQQSLKLSAS